MSVSTHLGDTPRNGDGDVRRSEDGTGGLGPEVRPSDSHAVDRGRGAGVVRARGVSFAYGPGVRAVDRVDLDVGVGEIVALVGPVGAGKTTLLRILAGDLRPTEGEVDLPPRRSAAKRVMVGYAGHEAAHFEVLSGWENAIFFARAGGLGRREAEASIEELVETLELQEEVHAPVSGYTREARHRLLLVEALAHRPALTLIDDPFMGLTQGAREALVVALRMRSAQRGTVVVACEDLSLVPEVADRIVFMHEGRVATSGRVVELLASVGTATRLEIDLEHRPAGMDPRFRTGVSVVSAGDPFVVEVDRGRAAVGEVLAALAAAGATVRAVTVREADLAEAFRRVTGVELRA